MRQGSRLCVSKQGVVRQFDAVDINGQRGQLFFNLIRHLLLIAPADVLCQEFFHGSVRGQFIILSPETMTFIAGNNVFNRQSTFSQGNDDLVGLLLFNARVVGALKHQQRRLNLVRGEERGLFHQSLSIFRIGRVPDALMPNFDNRSPISRKGFDQSDEIRRADVRNSGCVELRCESQTR